MRTVTNCYLLNLAIADASISILNTGFTWSYNFYYVWNIFVIPSESAVRRSYLFLPHPTPPHSALAYYCTDRER
ncbi:hypothetical protein ANCDUO_01594 [Ancylostoma duodenale]|uniref:7TM GPCR serpentine receptor class x (Srx) domain-containing protein n=1 Tax=Ancylostoma duodenale TaxID=51022 RepID=A0A0C2H8U5_9BILA|nr:hypothetical protein ANCDUO_01594 [Ancylostoma duodenale]